MRVYVQGEYTEKYNSLILKNGDAYFLILKGIDFEIDHVEAVYMPLLRVNIGNGAMTIEFPKLLIALMKKRPFIYLDKSDEEYLICL